MLPLVLRYREKINSWADKYSSMQVFKHSSWRPGRMAGAAPIQSCGLAQTQRPSLPLKRVAKKSFRLRSSPWVTRQLNLPAVAMPTWFGDNGLWGGWDDPSKARVIYDPSKARVTYDH